MAIPDPTEGDPSIVARMMDLGAEDQGLWTAQDLGPILKHQLAAPLDVDLGGLRPGLAARLEELRGDVGSRLVTFGDLLADPQPPLELLELAKVWAKRCRTNPEGPLPDDVATVIYLAAIAAALVRLGRRITRLSDEGMRHGLRWALGQPWLDGSLRDLFRRGCTAFGG